MIMKKLGCLFVTMMTLPSTGMAQPPLSTPQIAAPSGNRLQPVQPSSSIVSSTPVVAANKTISEFGAYQALTMSREAVIQYEQATISGGCFARSQRDLSLQLLDTPINSRAERALLSTSAFATLGCYIGGTRIGPVFLRGAIAEALFDPQTAINANPDLTTASAFVRQRPTNRRLGFNDTLEFSKITHCIAFAAPRETAAVLATDVGTTAENRAIDLLVAAAPACIAQGRFPRDGSSPFFRAYMAVAAYHWSQVQRGS